MDHPYLSELIKELSQIELRHLRLYKDQVLLDTYDSRPMERLNQYSITKNALTLLCGMLVDEGRIDPDDRLMRAFPEYKESAPKQWRQVTLRHLLTMSVGLEAAHLMYDYRRSHPQEDWLALAFSFEPVNNPGEHFLYSNVEPYLLGLWMDRLLNGELEKFAQTRLFDPLSIGQVKWEHDRNDRIFGGSGLMLNTEELARLGFLCLREGEYEGNRLVSKEWLSRALSPQIRTGRRGAGYADYGWFFWIDRHGSYRMSGKDGQILLNIPALGVTFACNANEPHDGQIVRSFWDHVYPLLK
ncbi:MAG: serine hydrolase domain-containing protein [Fastidiosipilaceae bacterium]|jgi:CubicO group peptidase (beta-lactamase class C family)